MIVCIDGNHGTGKSVLIARLKGKYPQIKWEDRGYPTKTTLAEPHPVADLTIILDCPPEVSRDRIVAAGGNPKAWMHTLPALEFFRGEYRAMARKNAWVMIDASECVEAVEIRAMDAVETAIAFRKLAAVVKKCLRPLTDLARQFFNPQGVKR